ncbi:hypothetical protein V8B97DRAFT_1927547 [Scleroderma yunnanense]
MAPPFVKKLLSSVPFSKTRQHASSSLSPDTAIVLRTSNMHCIGPTANPTSRMDPADNVAHEPVENNHRMDPGKVRMHFDRIGHFRVLVMGRSNAGKTTILQRICNTTELPEVFNSKGERIDPVVVQGSLERGYHNIEDELIFQSNPGFIFHDSRGFEAGSDSELKLMKRFVAEQATTMKLEKRIHTIWFAFQ